MFDGDEIREGLNKDLGYSLSDRRENIRRISEVSRLFLDSGLVIICSFISPTHEMRELAKTIIGPERFVEVYVNCPAEVCEHRDPKGLYKQARMGLLKDFTGIDSVYEPPLHPDVELRTDLWSVKKTSKYLITKVLPNIKYRNFKWFRIT
jgi:adenylyl-sulfate kinase